MLVILDYSKRLFEELLSWISKLQLFTLKYIIGTYVDTKLNMFGLALSATEEGAKGSKKSVKGPEGPKGPQALSKR